MTDREEERIFGSYWWLRQVNVDVNRERHMGAEEGDCHVAVLQGAQ